MGTGFGENLKRIREEKGLTQKELAKLSGVSERMIQRYENGFTNPRLEAGKRIAQALNVSVHDLMTDNEMFVAKSFEEYGQGGRQSAEALINNVRGLFAGGSISEEEMDGVMREIQNAYWEIKEKNRKNTQKKTDK